MEELSPCGKLEYGTDFARHARLSRTPAAPDRQLPAYMLEYAHVTACPKYFAERGSFEFISMLYTVSGCGFLEYGGQELLIRPGTCALLDCRPMHRFRTEGDRWQLKEIQFSGIGIGEYLARITGEGVLLQDDTARSIEKHLDRIAAAMEKGADQLELSLLLMNLLTMMVRRRSEIRNVSQTVLPAIEYIHAYYREKIDAESLAARCYISKYHFFHVFKAEMGMTPYDYLVTVRINHVKELLAEDGISMAEIAVKTGFNDSATLARSFKRVTGMSPSEYRKLI